MKTVAMIRDMRPYQAEHNYVFPDAVAEKLIAAGDARPVEVKPGDIGFAPEVPALPARPRTRYLTRSADR